MKQIDVDNYLDTENNFTALHFAAHFNRPDVVEILLKELKAGQCCWDTACYKAVRVPGFYYRV